MLGITYRLDPAQAEDNAARIAKVVAAVRASGLDLTYAAANVDGQGTFVHVVHGADVAALESLPEFQAFQAGLRAHLSSPPSFFDFDPIGMSGPLWSEDPRT